MPNEASEEGKDTVKKGSPAVIACRAIGIIYSPFTEPIDTPIQPSAALEAIGRVEIFEEYQEGLADLEGFSHIILLYHFHLIKGVRLTVEPFLEKARHGVFATRAPARPNRIGLSVVELTARERNVLHIKNVDILDGTPLLDIKPFVPEFDSRSPVRLGWLERNVSKLPEARDDGRFLD
jgi:tRNA-Thr(GGU) m(6)t(6)A37 methyltransferase TsaA